MSNLIVSGAKSAAAALVRSGGRNAGRILLKTATRVGLNYAKGALRRALDTRVFEGPRLESLHITGSTDGAPMPRAFGRVRLGGQVIWAARLKEHVSTHSVGGKGGPKRRDYSYTLSFAVGLCEGVIDDIGRIWAGGRPLETRDLNMRLYKGTGDQQPDPLIAEIEGAQAPSFRGTAYVVFEDMPVDDFGARLPQLSFEVFRRPARTDNRPRLEELVTGVDLIPGSGEFAYGTSIVEERLGPGASRAINMNNLSGLADMELALDQLAARLPNCRHVSLVVSWYGDDLRAGQCRLRPGIESRTRIELGTDWAVGSRTRQDAWLISRDAQGRPVFGGTPSDASVVEAVRALKARGFSVTFYPFIMLDIPPGNPLPNPYGGATQPVFPWRGRISCDPAPGTNGTADKTASARAQLDSFFGTCQISDFTTSGETVSWSGPDQESYRRMILHYAHLMKAAGGVDAFLIGSEMRGLTMVRDDLDAYPAVSRLRLLAADVRAVLGPDTGLSYAADWSEYFGHHPQDGSGDVRFHLDPLWADTHIDAVGIDAYFPLSDWRDTPDHLDRAVAGSIYEKAYLMANVEGGEGYDWYYASQADRDNQVRTPITDGAHNKPWVFRYKDVKSWWANPHYERIGGVEQNTPTAWQPQSKPVWFTEIGCPAIDKGANQPNVFWDPKSSESYAPYSSTGNRDDLIQRRYLEAFLSYWQADNGQNPVSSVYGGPMVDLSHMHIWCWDGRPWPDYPARRDVWSDGANWQTGHWISGRTGLVSLADMVSEIVQATAAPAPDVSGLSGMIGGYVIDRPMSARAALEDLAIVYGFEMIERAGQLVFLSHKTRTDISLSSAHLLAAGNAERLVHVRTDRTALPEDVRLDYIDGARDYQRAHILARNKVSDRPHSLDMALPVVLDEGQARVLAGFVLDQLLNSAQTLDFRLPPAFGQIEIGDIVELETVGGQWRIAGTGDGMDAGGVRLVHAQRLAGAPPHLNTLPTPAHPQPVNWVGKPEVILLDCVNLDGSVQAGPERGGPLLGVQIAPFARTVVAGPDGTEVELNTPIAAGTLLSAFDPGPVGRMNYAGVVDLHLPGIALASLPVEDLLAGGNLLAVEHADGWAFIQALDVELLGPDTYRLSGLLHGRYGSEADGSIPAGSRVVWMGEGWRELTLEPDLQDSSVNLIVETDGRSDSQTISFTYQARYLRPLSPVHLKAVCNGDSLEIGWIRRGRVAADSWSGTDIPLGEEMEAYELDFAVAGQVFATMGTNTPNLQTSLTDLESQYGAAMSMLDISVYQLSRAYGRGRPAHLQISL